MRPRCRIKGTRDDVRIYTEAAALPASWNALLPGAHDLHTSRLTLYEAIQLPDVAPFYAICFREDKPVALAYFQVLKVQHKHIRADLLKGLQKAAVSLLLSALHPRLLVAGHLFRHDIVTFYGGELSNIEAFRAYEGMIQAVLKESCALAVLVKDMPVYLVDYFQNFAPWYTLLRNDISMEMNMPGQWRSLNDYEAAIKHKYAQKLRKVRAVMDQITVKELDENEVREQAGDLHILYEQVTAHQPVRLGLLNDRFLPELKRFYGNELRIWAFYENGQMVAFASAWVREGTFDMFYIGFDYRRNAELHLYFNILYFSIEQAISMGASRLILGRTALEAKARLGCRPVYLYTFLYIRNRYMRSVVRNHQQSQYQLEGAWEERHPFRKSDRQ